MGLPLVGMDGTLTLFIRGDRSSLYELASDGDPFREIGVGFLSAPSVIDWNSGEDMDVLVGSADGALQFYEHVADGRLVEGPTFED